MKETFTRIWFTLYQENKCIKVRLTDTTAAAYIFSDNKGQNYVIPKIKLPECISYKYLNSENLVSLINILDTGDTIIDIENIFRNCKKRCKYDVVNGHYIRSFETQAEIRGYFWGILDTRRNNRLQEITKSIKDIK